MAKTQYLSVRETAERLGVHENTIRNWVRAGILPSARVPGTRFHRFAVADVERLQRDRGARVSSVGSERRDLGPELVDATQLHNWSALRDSHAMFPLLMRRLLVAAPGISSVSVRTGEGIAGPGWDGHAESAGTPFLPRGTLCFEFGAGTQPQAKADADYEKRRQNPVDVAQEDAIFVFATPRRWFRASQWEARRRAEGIFRDVRVLDADDIAAWLESAPAVHHWISEHLGRRPRNAQTLELWWTQFHRQTHPQLPLDLFLAGRQSERDELVRFFRSDGGVLAVRSAWRDDAIAFVAAAVKSVDGTAHEIRQTPLVVSAPDVWEHLVAQPSPMILVPIFGNPDVAAAGDGGHHVVLPFGQDEVARETVLELPRPHRAAAAAALEAAGVDGRRAYELAALARRSMPSLVRKLARDPRFARPRWSELPDAGVFAPLVLVGRWTAKPADREVVGRITGESWTVVERLLLNWRQASDPPFVQSGTEWHVASRDEAFLVLRDALTASDLERWHAVAADVLLEIDPRLDLPPEDQPMAALSGVEPKFSAVVRRGIGEGIAVMGATRDARFSDGGSGIDHARRLVARILGEANAADSPRLWQSLGDVLPLLAEAAPAVFLDALADDLARERPLLENMFRDEDAHSWLYTSSPHTGLLWALETLCWSGDYVVEAALALARLDSLDPGGRLANRPLASLTAVLVPWVRHTGAPLETRLRCLDEIAKHVPTTAWRLVMALWPSHHAAASPPHTPRFRDWTPETQTVLVSEWMAFIRHLVNLAVRLADAAPDRWAELCRRFGPLPPTEREGLFDALRQVAASSRLDGSAQLTVWESLHTEIARHRQFSSAPWTLDEEFLGRLDVVAAQLEPKDRIERFGWLFDWRPNLPDVDPFDHGAYNDRLRELRVRVVSEALARTPLDNISALAARSPEPRHLGSLLAELAPEELTPSLLTWLDSSDPAQRAVAAAWIARMLDLRGSEWFRDVLARPELRVDERREIAALSAPPTAETWETLRTFDPGLLKVYWRKMSPWHVRADEADQAARALVRHRRPWAAVDLIAATLHGIDDESSSVTPALVEETLDAAARTDAEPERQMQSIGYELGLLLDYLDAGGASTEKLAQYEFLLFPFIEDHRTPTALFETLSSDANVFVDLVCRVYRGKNEPRRQLDERSRALADHAWWVLEHWATMPGQREDGTLDGEYLARWLRAARLALAESDRADIGDEQVGQVLARSPVGEDGIWPAEGVRDLIETIGSPSIDTGVHLGVVNARGVTSRDVFDGGTQERDLAARYRDWAERAATTWPRTARLLRGLAETYERDAQHYDIEAEITADTD